ncbi:MULTISPECIES: hypothetical protein [unclassified Bosea (in: a-proteobacteria)]|uniref:hypothetical protein n=1 Tax=unclassified Bosea (in: a-proteobacteria) TaxID=2653178 RepID=UPI000F75D0A1|nr:MULTISPECIES: hypothetical protein [unclassified Bosea (in: a-proteobacteria)]AZO77477.1 hypothetical protein BLM15_07525 [Bosea sp. Tri-49]RXT18082.1 hypothetical protein B5U98_22675 [Bosea sp. Tri-39]RXT32680.1 hypothetical protein B5U99_29020 [Bosea sp. Tri-54]
MKIAGFEFAEGARFQKGAVQNASLVGQHIEMLRQQKKGELTPEDVLADARHGNSPLHSFFEWDDSAAAEQHRLHQARGLIRSVVAIYTSEDKPAVRQRAYVHIAEGHTSHYREAGHALSQSRTRKIVLQRAFAELAAWRQRYKDLKEFADLFEVVDETLKHLPKATHQ